MSFKHMAMWTWPGSVYDEDPERMVSRFKEACVDIIILCYQYLLHEHLPVMARFAASH